MKISCFLTFLLVFQISYSQQQEIDSIKKHYKGQPDTVLVKTINELAYRELFTDARKAETYAQEAVLLGDKIKFYKGEASAYVVIGMSHDLRGKYRLAVDAYEKGLRIIESSPARGGQTWMALYNGLGMAYERLAEYPTALEFYLKALQRAEQENNEAVIINVLLNIGMLYYSQREYDKALEYYQLCRERAELAGDRQVVAKVMNNVGIVYKDTKRYKEAIDILLNSLAEKKGQNNPLGTSASLTNLADVYKALGDYAIARNYLDEAEALKQRVNDTYGLIEVNDIRAGIYLAESRFDEAEALIIENLRLVNAMKTQNKSAIYGRLSEFYEMKNDYKSALKWHMRKTAYDDSVFNETKSSQLAELQTLYEVNKKENEIIRLEKERETERFAKNITLVSLVSFLIVSGCVIFLLRFRAKKKQQLFRIEIELQQKKVENAALREEELKKEIEFKNRELASYTINFVQKSELMEQLKRSLQDIDSGNTEVAKKIAGINKLVESNYQVDREWEEFRVQFENVHPEFFRMLKNRCPELTNGDLKLCALLKLNMNMKEASKILGISPESVKTARYRLRKKFGLAQDDNLVDFILKVEDEVISNT